MGLKGSQIYHLKISCDIQVYIASTLFCSMKATCIEARNNKIERIVFFNIHQFDIHMRVDQTDNELKNDKCMYEYNLFL